MMSYLKLSHRHNIILLIKKFKNYIQNDKIKIVSDLTNWLINRLENKHTKIIWNKKIKLFKIE